jgi:hypothetical protein
MPNRFEHPPQPGGDGASGIVVNHNVIRRAEAEPPQGSGELVGPGQWMTPFSWWPCQICVEIHEHRTGDVTFSIGAWTMSRVGQ